MTFDEVIEEALDAAACVLVMWSQISVKSRWVRTEAEEGAARNVLVPVLIEEEVRVPLSFRRIQAANLVEWDGSDSAESFKKLVTDITRIVGVPPKPGSGKRRPPEAESPERSPNLKLSLEGGVKIEFLEIEAGEFQMGSNNGDDDEKPVHRVVISKPFLLGKFEVTQEQWEAVMGDNPSSFKGAKLPVEQISWEVVQEFIGKLNAKADGLQYRLPTEAEWEYAARAGTTGDSAGDLDEMAWYTSNSGDQTHPVGQKKPNAWGLYDMHGNVWEWVQDCWHENYKGAPKDGRAWKAGGGGDCGRRVIRGGSLYSAPRDLRSSTRNWITLDYRDIFVGFRLAQDLD